jgi:hypothetical protein
MALPTNIVRPHGAPKVIATGPSSLSNADRLARNLGWFSIGLGAAEIIAARSLARALGMRGMEPLLRAFGARELASGMLTLSADKSVGMWSRVAGDAVDLATLVRAMHPHNWQRDNVKLATAAVLGVTLLDLFAATTVTAQNRRQGTRRSYANRSGFPRGVQQARGAARSRARGNGFSTSSATAGI